MPPVLLARGDRLGPYEIEAPLGAGAMGEVYRARDPRLDRFVAIKLLTGTAGGDARTQLEREARAAALEAAVFADGMTEALIAELAQIGALRVISRSSAMRFKNTSRPAGEIARELSVDAVIEGSARRVDDQIRITLELIHPATGRHLWAKSYDRDVKNVLQLQRDIASAVADEIQVALTPHERTRLSTRAVVDPAAYDAYLRGRQAQNRWTEEGLTTSVESDRHRRTAGRSAHDARLRRSRVRMEVGRRGAAAASRADAQPRIGHRAVLSGAPAVCSGPIGGGRRRDAARTPPRPAVPEYQLHTGLAARLGRSDDGSD